MNEDRKAAPISLRRRQAPQPAFGRISEVAAALSRQDSQYPSTARDVVTHDPEPIAESADKGADTGLSPSEPTSPSSASHGEQAQAKVERSAAPGALSRRVRVRCEPEELRALRAYAALLGVPLSDLLSEALKPLVATAVAAIRR